MKIGRAIVVTLICAAVLTLFTGCVFSREDANADSDMSDMSLDEVVDRLVDGVDVPGYEIVPLDESNFEFYAFTPYEEGITAVAADALVNVTPHSLVVIRTENGDAADLADQIFKNADPNKWLCVGSEIVNVANNDKYVVLVMSYRDVADDIISNFDNLSAELGDGDYRFLTAENTIRISE